MCKLLNKKNAVINVEIQTDILKHRENFDKYTKNWILNVKSEVETLIRVGHVTSARSYLLPELDSLQMQIFVMVFSSGRV